MTTRDLDLLRSARAARAERPVPLTRYRHVDLGLHVDGTDDPLLYVGFVTFQAEPFQPGAYVTGDVDAATGQISDIQVRVVEHPLDRDSSYAAAAGMAGVVAAHLDEPHRHRREDTGQPVDVTEYRPTNQVLPRVVVANPQTVALLAHQGRRLSYVPAGPDLDAATLAQRQQLRHGGHWMRELAETARTPGQSQVLDVLSLLLDHYQLPLPVPERGHLGAILGAIAGGPAGGWQREHDYVGPEPDTDTQARLWEDHTTLRRAARDGDRASADRLRAGLQARYEVLAAEAADIVSQGLQRLDELPPEPRFADSRRKEDLTNYTETAVWLVGRGGLRRAMPPLTHNHLTLDRRERAGRLYELRRLVTEPRLRTPLWDTGEAIDGTRTAVSARKVRTGELTPTGRARTTQVYDVEVELHAGIVPPAVGTRLLWAHGPSLQVTGVVTAVDGRQVVVHVGGHVPGKTQVARRAAGQADTWIAAEPPYDGPPAVPGLGDPLPATHQSPRPVTTIEPTDPDTEVDAILAVPVDPDGRSYT